MDTLKFVKYVVAHVKTDFIPLLSSLMLYSDFHATNYFFAEGLILYPLLSFQERHNFTEEKAEMSPLPPQ